MSIQSLLITTFSLSLSLAALAPGIAGAADPVERSCTRLLTQSANLHDPLRVLDASFHSLRFRDWMCNTGFRTRAELDIAAKGMDLPNPGLGMLLGYLLPEDEAAFPEALASFCSTGYQDHVTPLIRNNFQRVVAASMSDAYRACLTQIPAPVFGADGVFIYAIPDDPGLRDFTLHARWQAASRPLSVIASDGAQCSPLSRAARGDTATNTARFACHKPDGRDASVTLRIGRDSVQTIVLPGQTATVLARLADQQQVLADRLMYLESALAQPGPAQEAEPLRAGSACPNGGYATALELPVLAGDAPKMKTEAMLRLSCRKLPPNAP